MIVGVAIFIMSLRLNNICSNVIYCDNESISELYFNTENITTTTVAEPNNNQSRFSIETGESSSLPILLKERIRRKIHWHLFSKKFISYSDFKRNWYPSIKTKLKLSLKNFSFILINILYIKENDYWLLIVNITKIIQMELILFKVWDI